MRRWLLLAALVAAPARAEERDYCPERPGLNTPACIVDKGRVSIETALADWTLDTEGRDRTDTVLVADTLVRVGVSDTVEARAGWTPFGHQRERGQGAVDRVGDAILGLKASLRHPGGDGLSLAVLPYVTVPVGRAPIGAGDWGAGVLLPATYDLSDRLQLGATAEVDAAVDEDGDGRHLRFSGTAGVGWKLTDALTLTGEGQVEQDDDSAGRETHVVAAASLAVAAGKNLQLDLFATKGLNRDAPDLELQAGVSARF